MDLETLLKNARKRESDIALEFDRKTAEYQNKVLQNDEIRRNLKSEEEELKKQIPLEPFQEGSEWAEVLEEIRALERMIERGNTDG